MTSDDTEHTCLVAQALLRQPGSPERFARSLGWGMRWWLLGAPLGLGRATLTAGLKLWLGFPPQRSGTHSAGNGPAMRSALLGACLGHDLSRLKAYVRASTRLTHTDERAERGALLVALAAHQGATHGPAGAASFLPWARSALPDLDDELARALDRMEEHLARSAPVAELATSLGQQRGVSGYVYHTVPVALYAWLRWPGDFRRAVEDVVALGGDADTTGAIAGAVAGASVGERGVPAEWIGGLLEWPRSVRWMRRLAERLARQFPGTGEGEKAGPEALFWPGLLPRNALFAMLVLAHVLRRGLPPY